MEKYVDNVYLINMDKDIERLKKVTKECKKFNINFERLSGVDPLKLSKKELDKYVTKTCQNICPNGLVGCGISHMKIYEDALKNNYKNILVLEDDVYFDDELYEELDKAMSELPKDYDILYLGCSGMCDKKQVYNMDLYLIFHLIFYFLSKCKSKCNNECKIKKKINNKYIHVPEIPLTAHAMIISNKGCKKLLNLIEKLNYHIDITIAIKSNELNIYTTKKRLIYQTWNDSKNSGMSSNYLLNNYFKDIKNNYDVPYSYLFNTYVIKIYNTNITLLDIIFFLLGIFSYINKYLFIFLLIFLIINHKTSILISYLIGYLIIYIIFNLNKNDKIKI
jgi:GR25 family glycosyltransferase involved in LPS biosynthesis